MSWRNAIQVRPLFVLPLAEEDGREARGRLPSQGETVRQRCQVGGTKGKYELIFYSLHVKIFI